MSGSEIRLEVLAADRTSEVLVVDSDFRVLARGIGGVRLAVAPGIYRAKLCVGTQQREQLFAVEADEPEQRKQLLLEPLAFASPIPLELTAAAPLAQRQALDAASRGAAAQQLGQGAELLVFLRDPQMAYAKLPPEARERYARSFAGLALGTPDDSAAHPLESIGTLVLEQGWLVARAAVNPGAHVLSCAQANGERRCLSLAVPAGWSLQVFVALVGGGAADGELRADLDGAAMLLERPGAGFQAGRVDLRLLEVARLALARGHNVLDAATLPALLANPLLALVAAHLLLLDRQPDLARLQAVIAQGARELGTEYPDVRALAWKLEHLRGTAEATAARALIEGLQAPPLFESSWHCCMEAYRSLADKPPLDAGLAQLSGRRATSSVWLAWLESAAVESAPVEIRIELPDTAMPSATAHASMTRNVFEPTPASTKVPWQLGTAVLAGAGRLRSVFRGKLSGRLLPGWLSEEPAAVSVDVLPVELAALLASLRGSGERIDAQLVARLFGVLVERFDWKSLVGRLKAAARTGAGEQALTPLQRRLLLSLKAAREQFEEDGTLPDEAIQAWLELAEVPFEVLLEELQRLVPVALRLDREGGI